MTDPFRRETRKRMIQKQDSKGGMRAEPQATPNTHMVARDTHESQLPNKASHCRITRPQPLKGRAGGQRKLFNGDPRSQIPPALAPITPPLVELVTYWTGRVTPEGGALRIQREIGRNQNLEL